MFETTLQRLAATGGLAFLFSPFLVAIAQGRGWVGRPHGRDYVLAWCAVLIVALAAIGLTAIWHTGKKGER